MFQNDWLMRQIASLVDIITRLLFDKETDLYKISDQQTIAPDDALYQSLLACLEQDKLDEAEDILFDALDETNLQHLRVAIAFYQKLNDCSDAYLQEHNWSRQEIYDGMLAILDLYGLSELVQGRSPQ